MTEADLLQLELQTLWGRDERGRLVNSSRFDDLVPDVVLAFPADGNGSLLAFGAAIDDALAAQLRAVADRHRGDAPDTVAAVRRDLTSGIGAVRLESGPGYVFEAVVAIQLPAGLVRSSDHGRRFGWPSPPPHAGWTEAEWEQLLGGKLGPWAAVVDGDVVVSLCFSARLTDRAAEAGLRTEEPYRRRGYGVATTAAWAEQVIGTGRVAFYSTSADNLASRAIAARLGLRHIGDTWRLSASPA